MKRALHEGNAGTACSACITLAEKERMPWHHSYIDVFASKAGDAIQRKHDAAVRRRERHRAMTDLGLKRVRGNLGGTYYE